VRRLNEHKRATKKGDLNNNNIAEHHLKSSHIIAWDSATCLTYITNYYQRITLQSWDTNLKQAALNRCQPLPHLTQQETVTHDAHILTAGRITRLPTAALSID